MNYYLILFVLLAVFSLWCMYIFHERLMASNISNSRKLEIMGGGSLSFLGIVFMRCDGEGALSRGFL